MAQKKSNVGMWIGIGCGALLVIGALGSAAVYFLVIKPASEAYEAVTAGTGGTSSGSSTTSSGSGTSSGGGTCAKAAECCKAIVQKSGGDATASAGCDNLKNPAIPDASCTQALETYKKSATLLGVKCE